LAPRALGSVTPNAALSFVLKEANQALTQQAHAATWLLGEPLRWFSSMPYLPVSAPRA